MNIVVLIQTVLALLLIGTIILQARGTGLGRAWGGQGEFYSTRRGFEKILFRITIGLAFLFLLISIVSLLK